MKNRGWLTNRNGEKWQSEKRVRVRQRQKIAGHTHTDVGEIYIHPHTEVGDTHGHTDGGRRGRGIYVHKLAHIHVDVHTHTHNT